VVEFRCRVDIGGTEKRLSLGMGLTLEVRRSGGV
jgi:hypothetical protein